MNNKYTNNLEIHKHACIQYLVFKHDHKKWHFLKKYLFLTNLKKAAIFVGLNSLIKTVKLYTLYISFKNEKALRSLNNFLTKTEQW